MNDMTDAPTCILNRAIDPPFYGFKNEQGLVKPSLKELLQQFWSRTNIFATRKNWMAAFCWSLPFILTIPFFFFLFKFLTLGRFVLAFVYSMILLGSHGTLWLHRYSTHQGYQFSNTFYRFIVKNLVIKMFPEEVYVIPHHVHHHVPDEPGDPYNPQAGWWYCFLADANHSTNRNLNEDEYKRLAKLLDHTGAKINTYAQYQKWGTISNPAYTLFQFAMNWAFWFAVCYAVGGWPIVCTIFGATGVWGFGVRTFNFEGHGKGKDRRREGIDFYRGDWSVNQLWPGYVAGEWHNNHHLYKNGARSGFLWYQLDLPWIFINLSSKLGLMNTLKDPKADFIRDHYEPFLAKKAATPIVAPVKF